MVNGSSHKSRPKRVAGAGFIDRGSIDDGRKILLVVIYKISSLTTVSNGN